MALIKPILETNIRELGCIIDTPCGDVSHLQPSVLCRESPRYLVFDSANEAGVFVHASCESINLNRATKLVPSVVAKLRNFREPVVHNRSDALEYRKIKNMVAGALSERAQPSAPRLSPIASNLSSPTSTPLSTDTQTSDAQMMNAFLSGAGSTAIVPTHIPRAHGVLQGDRKLRVKAAQDAKEKLAARTEEIKKKREEKKATTNPYDRLTRENVSKLDSNFNTPKNRPSVAPTTSVNGDRKDSSQDKTPKTSAPAATPAAPPRTSEQFSQVAFELQQQYKQLQLHQPLHGLDSIDLEPHPIAGSGMSKAEEEAVRKADEAYASALSQDLDPAQLMTKEGFSHRAEVDVEFARAAGRDVKPVSNAQQAQTAGSSKLWPDGPALEPVKVGESAWTQKIAHDKMRSKPKLVEPMTWAGLMAAKPKRSQPVEVTVKAEAGPPAPSFNSAGLAGVKDSMSIEPVEEVLQGAKDVEAEPIISLSETDLVVAGKDIKPVAPAMDVEKEVESKETKTVEPAEKVEEEDWEDVDAEEAKEGDYVFI